jgi:hypothetical protein
MKIAGRKSVTSVEKKIGEISFTVCESETVLISFSYEYDEI